MGGDAAFEKAEVTLPGGKTLTITAEGAGPVYNDIRLGGKPLEARFLKIEALKKGGKLEFRK